ncbi:MAG: bifunctional UDP-N-acetylglucosamine diphosphorylase/glucosamine-1-phosphate N-acetyltransferase GlmU [Gammaproteobacteria bacterium]
MPLSVVILAAGQGTRMRSSLPKVLHPMAGRPLLSHVVDVAESLDPVSVHVVYGFGGDQVREAMADRDLVWHEQAEQLGTGHAVAQAMGAVTEDSQVLVLYGDVPLLRSETLADLVALGGDDGLGVLTVNVSEPTGYGRIVRDNQDQIVQIVEDKDATEVEKLIHEVNTGVVVCPAKHLNEWIGKLKNTNSQGEYYLTDIVELAVWDKVPVRALAAADEAETLGVNDKVHLSEAETEYRHRTAMSLMRSGVTLADPKRLDVRGTLTCGADVFIDVNAVFIGNVKLGDGVHIGPNVVVIDSQIEDGTEVFANCVIEKSHFGPNCLIGPFARVRPETYLGSTVKLGNFVEVKKSNIAKGSKVNHLTYVGDSTLGESVNVGAGTITCNYDGANKHRTTIGDNVFVGSGVQFIAPVEIGDGATIGAGSIISKPAPADKLTLSRGKQVTIDGWKRPVKKPKS